MAGTINRRRLIEAVILPLAFVPVVAGGGVPNISPGQKDRMLYLLQQAIKEVFPKELTTKEKSKIIAQAHKVIFIGLLRTPNGLAQNAAETGLALHYFITNMTAQGLYYIGNDSDFMNFFDGALPAMSEWLIKDELSLNGFNQARYALKTLQQQGYYRDVEWKLTHE